MVLSGVWWCNGGADFDPAACVPVPAGSYVRRVALTPHYDGAIRSRRGPAVIAICGIGPVNFTLERSLKAAVAGGVTGEDCGSLPAIAPPYIGLRRCPAPESRALQVR